MAYEKEIRQIQEGDGIIRDFPRDINRKYELARALLDAGRRLAAIPLKEASAFMDDTRFDREDPDPWYNVAPCAQEHFGDMMDLAENARQVPEISGFSQYEETVRTFVAEQTKNTGQQG